MLTGNYDNNSTSWLRYCWPSQFLFTIWTSYSSIYLSIYLRVWVGAAKEDLYIQWRYFNFDIPAKIPTFSILCYGKIWFECWSSHESAALKQTPSIWPSDPTLMSKLSVEVRIVLPRDIWAMQTACIKWTKWKHDVGKGKYKKFKSKLNRFFYDCLLKLPKGTLRALWRCRCWIKSG